MKDVLNMPKFFSPNFLNYCGNLLGVVGICFSINLIPLLLFLTLTVYFTLRMIEHTILRADLYDLENK